MRAHALHDTRSETQPLRGGVSPFQFRSSLAAFDRIRRIPRIRKTAKSFRINTRCGTESHPLRHIKTLAKRRFYSTSGEFAERARGWKRCACVIFVSGTLAERFRRKRTGATTWDEARAYSAAIEAVGNWSGQPVFAAPAPDAPAAPARITIEGATSIFLKNRESAQIAPATLRKYRTFTKQLTAYADGRGYVMIDQFTPADADLFYAGLKLGPRTKGTRLGVLRSFFRFAVNRKWMPETPVSADIKPPVGSSTSADKMPFSDEELDRIRRACDNPPVRGISASAVPATSAASTRTLRDRARGPAKTSKT